MVFYSIQLNDFVVDAICECGHLKTDHGSKLLKIANNKSVRFNNDGNCCDGQCCCEKFTWQRWATAKEIEFIICDEKEIA